MIKKAFPIKLHSKSKSDTQIINLPTENKLDSAQETAQMRDRLIKKKTDAMQVEQMTYRLLDAVNEQEAQKEEPKPTAGIEQMIKELHDQRDLWHYDPRTYTVSDLVNLSKTGKLLPEVEQAEWSPVKQSRFIESILLGMPVPAIYLTLLMNKSADHDQFMITDGQERIKALTDFKEQKLRLTGLTLLKSFNGKYQRELSADANYKLDRSMLTTIILYDDTKHQINAEIAQRLNN